ncbi:GARP complex subunit Vps52 [Schizosaccharomyces cryophilus OY26]|uniref:GARP complex subunit Vps52 n=1 Tax=Schizosaccharomyces cryophilus (strain OY26 / ATCC MYA-4695 / CBS 11777 / NBRC 106824 / NRRL Y48691) TaxID=653667 RepID=S9X9A4_SCHCR|nr:GARP complex subunit Vps52 [Schizosaccharomyces cryophilus OY26]EPY53782.1 GARP complex subunit Vps52 [Schizosaccharomyces cryophilus OY26]
MIQNNEKEATSENAIQFDALEQVLQKVVGSLEKFQVNLDAATADIDKVSQWSSEIQVRLSNMKKVESALGAEIDTHLLPPTLIKTICTGDMEHPSWSTALEQLEIYLGDEGNATNNEKLTLLSHKGSEEQEELCQKLCYKAIERIRNYIVVTIKLFRHGLVDVASIRKHRFIGKKNYYTFLSKHNPLLSLELRKAYINTMNWYYYYHFYHYSLLLSRVNILKGELIRPEEDRKGFFMLGKGSSQIQSSRMFSLDLRSQNFDINSVLMASTVNHIESSPQFLERIYFSWELVFTEHASAEYFFLLEYFELSTEDQKTTFHSIFDGSLQLSQQFITDLISTSIDSIAILKCIRFTQELILQSQKNLVPVIEPHYTSMIILLWPRLQAIMDLHSESLQKSPLPSKSDDLASTPHPLTQRVSELLYSLATLSANSLEAEPLTHSVSRLSHDFVALLNKFCEGMSDERKRNRFLSNNFTLISTVLSGAHGKLAFDQKAYFEELNEKVND